MARGYLQACAAMLSAIVLSYGSLAQDSPTPTQRKGTVDTEMWAGGVAAQHDGTTAFNTEVWMAGVRLGRILTVPHGPGWLHGTLQWSVDLVPLLVVTNLENAYGAEIYPIVGRWNFRHKGRSAPYFEMAGGVAFTSANIPPGHTSDFNVVPDVGFGWQFFRNPQQSIDLGIHAWHLSNAWTAPRNPSANGIQITFGYYWFKLHEARR